jgi:anti-sigma regulatory factor (Ser/Thr protein kinase)
MNQLLLPDIRVKGGPFAPAEVRSHLERELADELEQERLAEVRLLATELVSNSVRHGGVGSDGWVTAGVALDSEKVRVEIRDSSLHGKPVPRSPDYEGDGGGFGLLLLDQIASAWGVERDRGLCVWFELAVAG